MPHIISKAGRDFYANLAAECGAIADDDAIESLDRILESFSASLLDSLEKIRKIRTRSIIHDMKKTSDPKKEVLRLLRQDEERARVRERNKAKVDEDIAEKLRIEDSIERNVRASNDAMLTAFKNSKWKNIFNKKGKRPFEPHQTAKKLPPKPAKVPKRKEINSEPCSKQFTISRTCLRTTSVNLILEMKWLQRQNRFLSSMFHSVNQV